MTETILKRVLLAVLVVVLPLGFQSATSYETTAAREYVTWFGMRLTPYKVTENDLSLWLKNTVGHHPATDEWTQTTLGVWWFPGKIGTPPGNWLLGRHLHDCYVAARSDTERQKILGFARQLVEAKSPYEKSLVNERWNVALPEL
ncbi:hypothetical protein [Brevifollis gellanilyticus]|uniref:Uncharacterized protein n=1 Tax=Brevifollis gellanilyticus TaxID=748831 RepID=A0A512MFB3_9BACT|nr:hypothetical protein [Brevifollis gellanilyticus]GEP45396.1 hypothetical protein BGE01nite_46870 [Brevifollis gellanilyticus]